MSEKNLLLPIVLCGGSGKRLWPLSRKSFPKQYLSIHNNSNFSFLQKTLIRVKKLDHSIDPMIVCNEEHRFITAEQLREINIKPNAILLEPCIRNTAPAIAIAALHSISNGSDPILLILPSDHQILIEKSFLKSIKYAARYAKEGNIITFGVKPTFPSTGYGYIKSNDAVNEKDFYPSKVEEFIEKPNKFLAKKLFNDNHFTWNSGIFMSKASTIIQELKKYSPKIMNYCEQAINNKTKDLDFLRIEKESFENCPNISFDKAVMEKTYLGLVQPLNAEWSDIGSWKSLWENSSKDNDKNVLIGDALQISSKDSLISSNSRLTIALGIEDLIIVETSDAVLVANKNRTEEIKDLVDTLKIKNRIEIDESKKVYRPWGNYLSFEEDLTWKIKRIEVKPRSSLSLQMHKKRAEHWIVVKGIATVEINSNIFSLKENESCFIPKGKKHRLSNNGKELLIIIEVQSGSYLGEDDIIRFEDKYGRKSSK